MKMRVRYFDKGQRKPSGLFSVNTHPYMQPLGSEKQAASLNNAALQSEDTTRALNLCRIARVRVQFNIFQICWQK